MKDMDIEYLNTVHLQLLEKARQTNLDTDWNDAQALEKTIKDLMEVRTYFQGVGARLGALEAFCFGIITRYPIACAREISILESIMPDLVKEIREKADGHKRTTT